MSDIDVCRSWSEDDNGVFTLVTLVIKLANITGLARVEGMAREV